jgi:hypothetical protein
MPSEKGQRERPILFSGPMVRAILERRKTQTRRAVKGPVQFLGGRGDEADLAEWGWGFDGPAHHGWAVLARGLNERHDHGRVSIPCPYGEPGDWLWVRETWALEQLGDDGDRVVWKADRAAAWRSEMEGRFYLESAYEPERWRPSIHMYRWASRLTLEVTGVRAERLQDISEEDARAEGCAGGHDVIPHYGFSATPREHFRQLWSSIKGPESWDANPWVWVVEFRRAPEATP